MLIIKNIELAKYCFVRADITVISSLSNRKKYINIPVRFRCGSLSKNCIDRICEEVSEWARVNCEEELPFIDDIREKLETL